MAFEQRDLDNLSDELKRFTDGLRNFTPKMGASGSTAPEEKIASTFDKGTTKIVNALGNLGAQLTKNARSEKQKDKYVENFNKSVDAATKVQEDAAKATEKITADKLAQAKRDSDADAKLAETRRKNQESEYQRLKESVSTASSEHEKFASRSKYSTEALTENEKAATAFNKGIKVASVAFDVLSKSITGYTSALYNGERGAKVTAKALSDVGKPAAELINTFGNMVMAMSFFMPGGAFAKVVTFVGGLALKLFGKAGEAALKYNELASEQADKLYTSFMDLGKGGVNLAGGISETFETMQRFGMSVAEATQFTSMLAGSAKDLKFFGATAGQGAKEFSKIAGTLYKSDVGRQLELMGISAEEQRESALKYMSIQARTGQLQLKNTGDLVKASAAFTKELDLAATLAGNTRKEQMEAREMAMSDERFRSAMDEAVASGDTTRIAELEKANAMAAQLRASGDEQGAAGVLQLAAGRGAMTTDAAIAAQMQYGAADFIFDPTKGLGDIGQITGGMAANARRMNRDMAGVNPYIGNIATMQTTGVGSREFAARNAAIDKAMQEQGFAGTRDEYLLTEQGKRAATPDAKTAAMTDLRRSQQNTALMLDSFVNSFIDVSTINTNAALAFNAAVDKFGQFTGSKVAGGSLSTGGSPGTAGGAGPSTSATTPGTVSTSNTSLASRAGRFVRGLFGGSTPTNIDGSSTPSSGAGTDPLALLNFGGESGSRESFLQLNADLQQKVLAAAVEYNQQTGNKLRINSAFRSREKQQELYDAYLSGRSRFPAAAPGNSSHEHGKAVDIEQGKNDAVAIAALLKQGLRQNVKGDPVHFQARTGGIFRGPSTGYNVELHGDEIVVPANEGVSKQALNSSVFNQDTSAMDNLMSAFDSMHYKYDQIIELLSRSTDNSDKLVMATT